MVHLCWKLGGNFGFCYIKQYSQYFFFLLFHINVRISVIFRVRSAKAVKITDAALLKRLGVLCGCIGGALLVRTIVAPPLVVVGRTADDLKAYLCKTDWWDHTFTSSKSKPIILCSLWDFNIWFEIFFFLNFQWKFYFLHGVSVYV